MTLKQLQAEWRKETESLYEPESVELAARAAALTPFILQQERDRELIQEMAMCLGWSEDIDHSKLIKKDNARLKEMAG